MRLDHLLSKEHLAPLVTVCVTGRPCFLVEHWLFGNSARRHPVSTHSPSGELRNEEQSGAGLPSTLLGPEEAAASLRASRLERPAVMDSRMRVHDAWFRPYLENYTVDASIFWNGSLSYDGVHPLAVCM